MTKTYKDGLIEGIKMYSWMKNGISYVGTTGKTLKQAIIEINQEYVDEKDYNQGENISHTTGMIAWGDGEPCPVCGKPFDKPDIVHLLSHPEASKHLFGQKEVKIEGD